MNNTDILDGRWIDKWGSCRVCGGEIPCGHDDQCDYYKLLRALENCHVMARRAVQHCPANERSVWEHIIRFCEEAGLKPEILSAQVPTEITGADRLTSEPAK